MAWKRLERLTRSADVPVDADVADDAHEEPVPGRVKKAEKQKKATGGRPSKTGAESRKNDPAKAEGEHSDLVAAPSERPASSDEAPESGAPKKSKSAGKSKSTERKAKAKKRVDGSAGVSSEEVDRLVDEGMMIVRSALRMSTKNRLIMQVLGAGEAFDERALIEEVRTDSRSLAEEKSVEAERLEIVATKAAKKPGRATFHDDYRRQDVRALTLREQVGRETARRLHEFGDDDQALRELIHSARESALDDVIQARLSAVMPYRRDPAYRRERSERMRALADDLSVLRRRQKARLGDRIS